MSKKSLKITGAEIRRPAPPIGARRDAAPAALEQERLARLRAEIERCCPTQVPPPACKYEPCQSPRPVGMPELPKVPKPGGDHNPPPG